MASATIILTDVEDSPNGDVIVHVVYSNPGMSIAFPSHTTALAMVQFIKSLQDEKGNNDG